MFVHDIYLAGWISVSLDISTKTVKTLYNVKYLTSLVNPFLYMSKEYRSVLLNKVFKRTDNILRLKNFKQPENQWKSPRMMHALGTSIKVTSQGQKMCLTTCV